MPNDVNALQKWSNLWQCKCMYYGKNIQNMNISFIMKMKLIRYCSEEKDLGVIFDDTLKFDLHINVAIKKANSMLGLQFQVYQH